MNTVRNSGKKTGLPPGSLIYTGERVQDHVTVQLSQYNEEEIFYHEKSSIKELFQKINNKRVNWINVNGLHDATIIEEIGNHFGIHPLVLEDILHTGHMPKLDIHENYIFLTLKILTYNDSLSRIIQEHLSMILGDHYLITFQEKDGDVFDMVRENMRTGKGRLRNHGSDYLFYRLLDTVVDHYYILADKTEESLEAIEEFMLKSQADGLSEKILHEKKNMIILRRCIIPLREEVRKFRQKESPLIRDSTYSFIDDVFDHLMHLSQTLDGFRDLVTSLIELQMAVNSNRMNKVIETLTIFAAIFMPLTFIVGIYGMNFHNMPELEWKWGYPLIWVFMAFVAISMLIYIKRRRWM